MRCSSILQELTNWAIDRGDTALPERLETHLRDCARCREEWKSIRQWTELLRPSQEETWQPEEGFFERLTEQAMLEKRRAAITESTRRDLALDGTGWIAIMQQPLYRWLPSLAIFLLIAIPLGLWLFRMQNTIGEFDFSSGQVIAQARQPLDPRKGMTIKRNTSVQTPQNAESIIRLYSGSEICVASLSRVTFIDKRTVRVDHGKAYFDISKQKSGFIVQLPQGEVKVLGTAFLVSIAQGKATVTVTRGTVQVMNGNASVQVESGMESIVASNQRPTIPRAVQPQKMNAATRWISQIWDLRNQEELRKYYPSLAAPTPKESNQ